MAVDMFLKINKIDGEAKDKTHKGEIDVLAWSWGCSQSGTFHTGGGGGSGKANFQDISITKYVDQASSPLMLACATGEHIDKATLYVRKAGKNPLEYIVIEMEKLMVTSVSTGGSGGEDQLTENVTLNFAKSTYKYQKQNDTGGKDGATKDFKADIEGNDFSA